MTGDSARLLLASPRHEQRGHWQKTLEAEGWHVEVADDLDKLNPSDAAQYQVVLFEGGEDIPDYLDKLSGCRGGDQDAACALLPVLNEPSADVVIGLIREGVIDVLFYPFTDKELLSAVSRVADHKSIYEQNLAYSKELEKTNRELSESLNILKMDQLAGRQVQKTMLPVSPLVHGDYTIAHRILPSLYLSGDFVGYNIVFDRYLLFYLADVSGHGASSAFITVLLKFLLRRILRRHVAADDIDKLQLAPQGFLEHVNRQILATGLEKHLTMFAGAIDMETDKLRYSIASQVPMPILTADGKANFLRGKGKPIGLFDEAVWEIEELELPPECSLVVASDGLLDILPGEGLAEKEEALLQAVGEAGSDHDAICRRLGLDDVQEAADDISLLTIVRRSRS